MNFCPYCRSEYHDSEFHPGTCTNCGAPKNQLAERIINHVDNNVLLAAEIKNNGGVQADVIYHPSDIGDFIENWRRLSAHYQKK